MKRTGMSRPSPAANFCGLKQKHSVLWKYLAVPVGVMLGTGGVASLFEHATTAIDHFDHDLTIRGLLEIYRRNARPAAAQ